MKGPGSIRRRLQRALTLWAVLWSVALGVAVWLAVREEVNELLDDTLQSAAEGMIGPLAHDAQAAVGEIPAPVPRAAPPAHAGRRFVWQVVAHANGAQVLRASSGAPLRPLQDRVAVGFADQADHRIYGLSLGHDALMLYVAQTRLERREAQAEIVFMILLAGVPMVVLAVYGLGRRVRLELAPLQALSARLADHDPLQPGATLGVADHEELRPVQHAIDALAARLARRVSQERAFSGHVAHALRTPLAGIDAQLAVALREASGTLRPRLQRIRAGNQRLQRVVEALLALFRSGLDLRRGAIDLQGLVDRLPPMGLTLHVHTGQTLHADADLLTAALLNLLDNAQRHGATTVDLSTPQAQVLRLQDDGRGADAAHLQALRQAVAAQAYANGMGLGLMLADLVARAHGGRLQLPEVPVLRVGFAAELDLGPA